MRQKTLKEGVYLFHHFHLMSRVKVLGEEFRFPQLERGRRCFELFHIDSFIHSFIHSVACLMKQREEKKEKEGKKGDGPW